MQNIKLVEGGGGKCPLKEKKQKCRGKMKGERKRSKLPQYGVKNNGYKLSPPAASVYAGGK